MPAKVTPRERLESENKLDPHVIAVKANGKIVDLHTPIDPSTPITPIRDTDPDGLAVIRHSTAHVMADAVQRLFPGTQVTIGPAIEDGFYYDFEKAGGGFTDDDLRRIEEVMARSSTKDTPFRREVITREEANRMFTAMGETLQGRDHPRHPQGEEVRSTSTAADPHEWLDVCEGPHVPSTGFLKAVKLTHVAGAYWRGDERNPMLQRIYGTAFPIEEALDEHLKLIEQAQQRDHRKLGKELELFMFDDVAPAMPFFLPRGRPSTTGWSRTCATSTRGRATRRSSRRSLRPKALSHERPPRQLQRKHVPASGRRTSLEGATTRAELKRDPPGGSFALKPMNCPSHCVIFGNKRRSYRELPWRVADFGRLHRYERGGVVHGLARVRSFAQDDAHIFCAEEQVAGRDCEVHALFHEVYKAFGFEKIDIKLATRPRASASAATSLGPQRDGRSREGLEQARARLRRSRRARGRSTARRSSSTCRTRSSGAGSSARCSTIRTCRSASSCVHRRGREGAPAGHAPPRHLRLARALLRVYLEHCGGNFPAWLAPKQAIVLTVSEKSDEYARKRGRAAAGQGAARRERPLERQARGEDPQRASPPLPLHARRRAERGGKWQRGRPLARRGRARRDEARGARGEDRRRRTSAGLGLTISRCGMSFSTRPPGRSRKRHTSISGRRGAAGGLPSRRPRRGLLPDARTASSPSARKRCAPATR